MQFGRSWAEYRTWRWRRRGIRSSRPPAAASRVSTSKETPAGFVARCGCRRPQLPNWIECQALSPLILKGRVYVVQPGVAAVTCLNLASGESHWSRPVVDVQRLVWIWWRPVDRANRRRISPRPQPAKSNGTTTSLNCSTPLCDDAGPSSTRDAKRSQTACSGHSWSGSIALRDVRG